MKSLRPQFSETISRIGAQDSNVFVIVGDISHGLLSDFRSKFPDRYRNIGICEPAMVSVCAGLNAVGFNPVIHTITPFLIERSFEQLKLDFGYQKLDCNLISVGSSYDYTKLGCSHHSYIDVALMSSIEGSKIFVPGSKSEFDRLFSANYNSSGIKYFRLTEYGHGLDSLTDGASDGKSARIRIGQDLTIVALGPSLRLADAVAECLESQGISVELIYVNSFKPFDSDPIIASVEKTRCLISISQLSSVGGLGSLCLEAISGRYPFQFKNFEIETFIRGYGSIEDLNMRADLNVPNIVKNVMCLVN